MPSFSKKHLQARQHEIGMVFGPIKNRQIACSLRRVASEAGALSGLDQSAEPEKTHHLPATLLTALPSRALARACCSMAPVDCLGATNRFRSLAACKNQRL